MKKKLFKICKFFAVCLLIIPCMFLFSACSFSNNTPYIGENGNWFVGGKDTGVLAEGKNGADGADGVDGQDAEPVDTYEIYLNAKKYENYKGSYLDFIKEYFTVTTDIPSAVSNQCVMSTVGIIASNVKGSGVIYELDDDGSALIITNYHVVCGSGSFPKPNFYVYLYGQQETNISATFVGGSSTYDLAILKVTESETLKNSGCKAVTFNTSPVTLGENCIAIGNPMGYGISISKGIVSVDSEYANMTIAGTSLKRRFLRHDAFIYNGSSGGGLFDFNGNLIGINAGGRTDSDSGNEVDTDIHFAIPASRVQAVVSSILDNTQYNKPSTPNIGIVTDFSSKTYFNAESGKVETKDTIEVKSLSGAALASGNLAVGDVITSLTLNPDTANQKTITLQREFDYTEFLLGARLGDILKINISRGETNLTATLEINTLQYIN